MKDRETPDRTIDVRGLSTPQPVLVLADEADRLAPGETLEVLSDDPCSPADFVRWSASVGMEIMDLEYGPLGLDRFMFRRPSAAPPRTSQRRRGSAKEMSYPA